MGGAEGAAPNLVAAELGELAADFVAGDHAHILQSHGNLLFVVGAQVGDVLFIGRAKKISLRTVVARVAKALFEARIERDRVKRHLDVDRRRKLGTHAAHALARGSLAQRGLPLNDENPLASTSIKLVADIGAT